MEWEVEHVASCLVADTLFRVSGDFFFVSQWRFICFFFEKKGLDFTITELLHPSP